MRVREVGLNPIRWLHSWRQVWVRGRSRHDQIKAAKKGEKMMLLARFKWPSRIVYAHKYRVKAPQRGELFDRHAWSVCAARWLAITADQQLNVDPSGS